MKSFTGFVVYALIWWTVLFAVLPFGVRPVDRADNAPGGWRGAPENPHILRKALVTTLIATALWGVAYVLITTHWISFRADALAMPDN